MEFILEPNQRKRTRNKYAEQQLYRRKKIYMKFINLSVTHEDYDAVKAMAKKYGISVPEMMRTFITWGLESELK